MWESIERWIALMQMQARLDSTLLAITVITAIAVYAMRMFRLCKNLFWQFGFCCTYTPNKLQTYYYPYIKSHVYHYCCSSAVECTTKSCAKAIILLISLKKRNLCSITVSRGLTGKHLQLFAPLRPVLHFSLVLCSQGSTSKQQMVVRFVFIISIIVWLTSV